MESSRGYYSNSLLSTYLNGSNEDLTQPETPGVPEISVVSPEGAHSDPHSANLASSSLGKPGSLSRPGSVCSQTSSVSTLYSSVSNFSDDTDLESVKLKLEEYEIAKPKGKLLRIRHFFKSEKVEVPEEENENTLFFRHVCARLTTKYYAYSENGKLDVPWAEACEVFLFGDTLLNILPTQGELLRYIVESSYELGEVKFSNLNKFHTAEPFMPETLLRDALPAIHEFNHVLDLYAESEANAHKPELYEKLIRDANRSEGLCVPLAIAMFGNWLLSYNKSDSVANNYDNTLILNYFRKAARLSMALRKITPELENAVSGFEKLDAILLNRFLGKDATNALSLSLHSLAEYYQHIHNHDVAVTLWELNCHLTGDLESGNLATLGLTDGYGLGNKIKEHSHLGKRSKRNKFNTKRRIAHLYRILLKRPDFHEYGVSWATKEKYD